MNFSGILIGVLTFFLIGLFHPIVIYAEYYFGSRCWPVFLLVGILCMILSVRMQKYFGRFPGCFGRQLLLDY
ncbi:MAG: DUF4491 family protein [Clostridium sp.]